jgi:hypothetical protein
MSGQLTLDLIVILAGLFTGLAVCLGLSAGNL